MTVHFISDSAKGRDEQKRFIRNFGSTILLTFHAYHNIQLHGTSFMNNMECIRKNDAENCLSMKRSVISLHCLNRGIVLPSLKDPSIKVYIEVNCMISAF